MVVVVDQIGYGAGLHQANIAVDGYSIFSFQRMQDLTQPLHVYIEGDGYAWEQRHRPSTDPTPLNPMTLRMAAKDQHPNILYMARPCQYTRALSVSCNPVKWTHHRFSVESVEAMNAALQRVVEANGVQHINLYGYSGGGAMAVLLAANRQDIKEIRTVAANLDTDLWVKHHKVSPMQGSLNPLDIRDKISHIPQLHTVGAVDEVVPAKVVHSYAGKSGSKKCIKTHTIQGTGHFSAWQNYWLGLLQEPLSC